MKSLPGLKCQSLRRTKLQRPGALQMLPGTRLLFSRNSLKQLESVVEVLLLSTGIQMALPRASKQVCRGFIRSGLAVFAKKVVQGEMSFRQFMSREFPLWIFLFRER